MPALQIARAGNPILRRKYAPVPENGFPGMMSLVEDLQDTLIATKGVGVAAPQIGYEIQMLVYRIPSSRSEDGTEVPMTVLLNPQITALSPEVSVAFEECLSMPGLAAAVPRFTHIGLRATLLSGETFEREINGFHARVLQHGCDHLDGKLFMDRITDFTSFGFSAELLEAARHVQKTKD